MYIAPVTFLFSFTNMTGADHLNDVCVLQLTEPFEFQTSSIQPGDYSNRAYSTNYSTVTALGMSSSLKVPQKINLLSVEIRECKRLVSGVWFNVSDKTSACTTKNPFEDFDVGSPIFISTQGRLSQIGILGYRGDVSTKPAIYTKLNTVFKWIQNVAHDICPTPISVIN